MENEPFLSLQSKPQLRPTVEDDHHGTPSEIQDNSQIQRPSKKHGSLHRCKTAPAMAVMRDRKPKTPQLPKPKSESSTIIRQAFFLLSLYLLLGVAIYSFNRDEFSGIETHPVVDALYFCIVTMCTIGYENMILTGIHIKKSQQGFSARNYIVDVDKGRMRIRLKVGLALGVVVLCVGIGTLMLYFLENLDWIDSVYLSVMSVTTVGYGDRAFKTPPGRLFAGVWLLISTLAVARAFLYLAEARVDKRHRRIAKWVLHRDITIQDLLAADINNDGFISLKLGTFAMKQPVKILAWEIPGLLFVLVADSFHVKSVVLSPYCFLGHKKILVYGVEQRGWQEMRGARAWLGLGFERCIETSLSELRKMGKAGKRHGAGSNQQLSPVVCPPMHSPPFFIFSAIIFWFSL
ncbi:hypothetical protein GOBAR_AA22550 [Gossypium barbadense]|uniref:Potassium channel domain-containing protein n=1 Tax=Gossypium barbadense TaxID=3634 RepID=A0A2P5X468_GOSBA|nr:hypothetical protein GOBAR_AA22550 [Gossypium barbadense]